MNSPPSASWVVSIDGTLWGTAGVRRDMKTRASRADRDGPGDRGSIEGDDADAATSTAAETLLALLGDEYTCRLLTTLDGRSLPAAALVERCEMSRATVYRRLDRLEDAGLVTSQLRYDPDGHHRREFELALDSIELRVDQGGVDGTVRTAEPADD
jgi:DNA-binding transcriptional ArsR family regulator